jgi:hypothetical protein
MTPRYAIARLDRAIAKYGQAVTLQRTAIDAASGAIIVSEQVTCPAHVRASRRGIQAGKVQTSGVILSPTGLGTFGIPARDDKIVIDTNPSNITQIAPLYYGGQLVRVNLLCRG